MERENGAGGKSHANRWRRQREENWRRHMAQWRVSGLSQAAYCRKHALAPADFSWWKYEVARRDETLERLDASKSRAHTERSGQAPASVFIPLRLTHSSPQLGFEILLRDGDTLRVPANFDDNSLKRLIAALREEERAC